ncbi:MAG: LysR family transcriptional regulator [Alphaproteobacteria bacterium]|nr:LysR family transcriptional regulator [Alphaproteobacteria bacterium]MBV8410927.1 LysR family transcriptional regulator [Alphaproteobacteria bacterium]
MDRILSMAVFKRVVDAGSFAGAAPHLGMSPEMVGNHVKALEAHLGVRLLNRTTRRMRVTEAGAAYHARCAQILSDIEEAEAEAGAQQVAPSGILRIAGPMTFGELHLGSAIAAYMDRHPAVKVDVFLSDRYVNLIDEGFDLAIRIGEPPDSSLISRRVASASLVLCASPDYLVRNGAPQKPADLSQHACLVYADLRSPRTWRFSDAKGHTETVQINGPFSTNNPQLLLSLAAAGHGVLLWPSFAVGAEILSGRLVPLLTQWRTRELTIWALYPHRQLLSPKVRSFVDFLVQRYGGEPEWEKWRLVSKVPGA